MMGFVRPSVKFWLYPQCLASSRMYGVHLMCDRTHRKVTKMLKTPIKRTQQNTHTQPEVRGCRSVHASACVCVNIRALYVFSHIGMCQHSCSMKVCIMCVFWLRSKASLTSQHGLSSDPLCPPPWPPLRSPTPTAVTWPITGRRCDGQPPTPRTARAEGLDGEDECGVNKGLWCWCLAASDWTWS